MALDREQLFVALEQRLQQQLGNTIATFTRRVTSWDDNPPTNNPTLLMLKKKETKRREERGVPIVWTLYLELWVYVNDDGTGVAQPSTLLNQILTAIEAALEVQGNEATAAGAMYLARRDEPPAGTTLGGLCMSCEIGDEILVFEGTQGHTGILKIPVEIMAAAEGGM
jgi:hypothetical protein